MEAERRMLEKQLLPDFFAQLENGAIDEGDDRGRSLLAGKEGHLPEGLIGTEDRHAFDAQPVLLQDHLHGSGLDHVQGVADLSLLDDGLSGGESYRFEFADDAGQVLPREAGKERYVPDGLGEILHYKPTVRQAWRD